MGEILTHFRGFWLFLGSSLVLGHFDAILGRFGLLLPACLLAVGVFFELLCLALPCIGCFGCSGLLWLACAALAACAFRSIATQVSFMLGSFFALVAHFFELLRHLKLSCIFVSIFCDFC